MQAIPVNDCSSTILRIKSLMRYSLAPLLFALLSACGGGGAGGTNNGMSAIVSGVAATGMAINGSVALKDAAGVTVNAAIAQPSGTFSIDVTGLTPPYFLKATDTTGTTTLYSIAGGSGNFNINPLTNLTVVAAAMSIDPTTKTPDAVFNNPTNFASLTPAQIQAATTSVMAKMSPAFQAALSANGASNFNPLTDSFQVGNGMDKVFDNYTITLNIATGEVQEIAVSSNTTTTLGLVDELGSFPAAGVYDGAVDTTQSGGSLHQVHDMLVTSSGEMRFVMDNGMQVIAQLSASGATVTGSGKAYALTSQNGVPTNFTFADGSTAIDFTINGTLGTGTLSGTYSYGNYTDFFSFALNTTQTNTAASLSKLAGSYASSTESSGIFIGHIEANGHIWGSGQGLAYSGLIQVIDPNTNIYRVTLAYLKQDGTASFVSGLATFYEVSPTTDNLPKPTTLVPDGYTGDVASLSYSQSVAGSHGKLLIQLSSPLQQIFVSAVRMTTQLQTIALQPSADSLMIQAIGVTSFSITASGNIQYSGSGEIFGNSGSISSSAGAINVIGNIGSITLNGAGVVSTLNPTSLQSGQLTAWQQNSIISNSYFSYGNLSLGGTGNLYLGGTITGSWTEGQSGLSLVGSTGSVSGVGGLVGMDTGGSLATSGSISVGSLTSISGSATNYSTGGLVGYNSSSTGGFVISGSTISSGTVSLAP